MNFYYSRLNFLDVEKIIHKYKNEAGANIFCVDKPLAFLNVYLSRCINEALKNTDNMLKIFDYANVFCKKRDNKTEGLFLLPTNDPLKWSEKNNVGIKTKDIADYYEKEKDGIQITPLMFEAIVNVIMMGSAFGLLVKIEEIENSATEDRIKYKIVNYGENSSAEDIAKMIEDPYNCFSEDKIHEDILEIKVMPWMTNIKLKQTFIDVLTGVREYDDTVFNEYKQFIFINGKPFDFVMVAAQGQLYLLYQILFLAINFSYNGNQKKNPFLTALKAHCQQTSETELAQG